jgi:hypothetical protein
LRQIKMRHIATNREATVSIDENTPLDSGAFGTIYAVEGLANAVVKRLEVDPPRPLDAIREYTAHITVTRDRLEAILAEEKQQARPRAFIIDYITNILAYSLSTHWACDIEALHITAVWILQRRAPGNSLKHHFESTTTPVPEMRKRIAREFIARMRTLRRADLVHLDCVHDNIFLQLVPFQVTAIDLDGCGIARRDKPGRRARNSTDEWEYPPATLGHTRLVRLPPWYPPAGVRLGPRKGNYLFAERWVVLDTVIRILTWGKFDALSWLQDSRVRTVLGNAYKVLSADLQQRLQATSAEDHATWWVATWQDRLRTLAVTYRGRVQPPAQDFWTSRGHPACLTYFAELAERAYFEPQVLSAPADTSPLYDVFIKQLR